VFRMRSATRLGALSLLLLVPLACGGGSGGGGATISDQPMTGKINGMAWTLMVAETDSFLSTDKFFANLYNVPIASPCNGGFPTGSTLSMILNVPKAVGSYNLGFAQNLTATFVIDDGVNPVQNNIALQGTIEVTALTATTITGGANITYNASNTVDGTFTINICP
jgi:hypothetical protein